MIEIKFTGSADEVREEMARMLGLVKRSAPPAAPAAIQPTKIDRAKTVSGIAEAMNADTAEALETPVNAPETPVEAQAEKDGQTVAEAAAEAESGSADDQQTSFVAADAAPPSPKGKADGEQEITLVQARERMNGLRQKFGAKAVRQVLDTLGFPKFTDVPSERYPELMVLCDAMEKGMTNA